MQSVNPSTEGHRTKSQFRIRDVSFSNSIPHTTTRHELTDRAFVVNVRKVILQVDCKHLILSIVVTDGSFYRGHVGLSMPNCFLHHLKRSAHSLHSARPEVNVVNTTGLNHPCKCRVTLEELSKSQHSVRNTEETKPHLKQRTLLEVVHSTEYTRTNPGDISYTVQQTIHRIAHG